MTSVTGCIRTSFTGGHRVSLLGRRERDAVESEGCDGAAGGICNPGGARRGRVEWAVSGVRDQSADGISVGGAVSGSRERKGIGGAIAATAAESEADAGGARGSGGGVAAAV